MSLSNPPKHFPQDTLDQDNEELINRLERIPGVMVLLPTPGTSGRKNTVVRIPLAKLETLLVEARIKAVKHLVDHYKENGSYGYGDSGEWMVDAEEYLAQLNNQLKAKGGDI